MYTYIYILIIHLNYLTILLALQKVGILRDFKEKTIHFWSPKQIEYILSQ